MTARHGAAELGGGEAGYHSWAAPGRSWGDKDAMKEQVDIASVMEAAEQQDVAQQLMGADLSSIVCTYSSFKEGYACEGYLSRINNRRLRMQFSNVRLGNISCRFKPLDG